MSGPALRIVRLGIQSLMLHKLRSALTTLGVLFGVASVVAMLAIGEGASFEAQERIRAMGSTNLILESRRPAESDSEMRGGRSGQPLAYGLEYDDLDAIRTSLPGALAVVPVRQIPRKAVFATEIERVNVFGTGPAYARVAGIHVREGRFLSALDEDEKRNVAVLGADAAHALFPFTSPLDRPLRLGNQVFRVVGVLERPESSAGGAEAARTVDSVLVPLSAARSFFGEVIVKSGRGSREVERVQLHRILVQVGSNDDVPASAAALRALVKHRHAKAEDYTVTVPLELLRQAEETKRIFSIVLGSIAAISLLVGGIGIMNVMLATVTERTQEIGVRRALGARRSQILAHFLVETLALTSLGGILGVLLGLGIPWLVTRVSDLKAIIQPEFPALAFAISATIGVGFGLYPAWRAAHMDPVEALRHQ